LQSVALCESCRVVNRLRGSRVPGMLTKAMEAGKTLESTSDRSSGVRGAECRESLIVELERPSLAVLWDAKRESEQGIVPPLVGPGVRPAEGI